MSVYSIRVPETWGGLVNSASVQGMLTRFLKQPRPLSFDPGPGELKISLSLPKRAVKVISGLLDDTESGALRRIIAANVGILPPVRSRVPLSAPPAFAPVAPRFLRALPAGWEQPTVCESCLSGAHYGHTCRRGYPADTQSLPVESDWEAVNPGTTWGVVVLMMAILFGGWKLLTWILSKPGVPLSSTKAVSPVLPVFHEWEPLR